MVPEQAQFLDECPVGSYTHGSEVADRGAGGTEIASNTRLAALLQDGFTIDDIRELIDVYVATSTIKLAEAAVAAARVDLLKCSEAGHYLAGMALNVGFAEVCNCARALEAASREARVTELRDLVEAVQTASTQELLRLSRAMGEPFELSLPDRPLKAGGER